MKRSVSCPHTPSIVHGVLMGAGSFWPIKGRSCLRYTLLPLLKGLQNLGNPLCAIAKRLLYWWIGRKPTYLVFVIQHW